MLNQVDKHDIHTFKRVIHECGVISQISSQEVKCEEREVVLSFEHEIFKSWEMVQFGVVKKDPGLLFHFHVLNLF